jgi:putative endonuclease
MKIHQYYVYILTNRTNKVLYVGVTNDLQNRCYQHKHKLVKGFTQRYNIDKLVYFEQFDQIEQAIGREKQIKGLLRIKKIGLIEEFNSNWENLCPEEKVIIPLREKHIETHQ